MKQDKKKGLEALRSINRNPIDSALPLPTLVNIYEDLDLDYQRQQHC